VVAVAAVTAVDDGVEAATITLLLSIDQAVAAVAATVLAEAAVDPTLTLPPEGLALVQALAAGEVASTALAEAAGEVGPAAAVAALIGQAGAAGGVQAVVAEV
jgi:hypothetical protein